MPDTLNRNPQVESLIGQIQMTAKLFAKDLDAMPHEMLGAKAEGKARSGYDLVCEVASLNQAIADQAGGKGWEKEDVKGWMRAPAEFCTHENAKAKFEASVKDLTAALGSADEATLAKVIQTPFGPMPMLDVAQIVPSHIMYHSGQLNYIQTLHGDDAFHWGP